MWFRFPARNTYSRNAPDGSGSWTRGFFGSADARPAGGSAQARDRGKSGALLCRPVRPCRPRCESALGPKDVVELSETEKR